MPAGVVRSYLNRTRTSTVRAVSLGALLLVGVVVQAVVAAARPDLFSPGHDVPNAVVGVVGDGVGEILVGMVLASRLPRNPIGWLLLGFGASTVALTGSGAIAESGYGTGHPSVLAEACLVLTAVAGVAAMVTILLVVALFPTGTVRGRVRRALLRASWLIVPLLCVPIVLSPTLQAGSGRAYKNPLPPSHVGFVRFAGPDVGSTVFVFCLVVIAVDAVVRGLRTRGVERQQMKLLGYAVVGWVAVLALGGFIPNSSAWSSVDWIVGSNLIAVAIGVAVLRYRLYDLDQVISRTVSYAVITGILIGVYAGLVTLSTRVLPFSSAFGVAVSTLSAAALFYPLRRGVQRSVDRRFNRARYDADNVAAAFAERLRTAVDLDTIRPELLAAVQAAIEPRHVSLWLAGEHADPSRS